MSERDEDGYRDKDAFDPAGAPGGDMFASMGDTPHPASARKSPHGVMGPPPGDGTRKTVLLAAGIVGGLVLAGVGAWMLGSSDGGSGDQPVPVITAEDPGPYRVKPEDPGGQRIDHQDMMVYDQLSSAGSGDTKTENLLAAPSAPAPVPEPVQETTPEPGPQAAVPQRAAAESTPAVVDAKPEPAPTPAPSRAGIMADGPYMIQLGALRSEDAATAALDKLVTAHAAVLKGVRQQVVRADLGSKGTYYRMRVGYFADRPAATATCDALKGRGQDCLVVAR